LTDVFAMFPLFDATTLGCNKVTAVPLFQSHLLIVVPSSSSCRKSPSQ
jgi:hypothetical protein